MQNFITVRKPIIEKEGDKNRCLNCKDSPKFTFTFGYGVEEIEFKLCRECTEKYKDKLDKEFGNTLWGTIDKLIKAKKEKNIRIIYSNFKN